MASAEPTKTKLCAIHLRNRLEGRPGDPEAIRRLVLAGGEVARFHDPSRPYLQPEDVDIALDTDRYNFAIRIEFEDGRPPVMAKAYPNDLLPDFRKHFSPRTTLELVAQDFRSHTARAVSQTNADRYLAIKYDLPAYILNFLADRQEMPFGRAFEECGKYRGRD